jgi:hypothetical protein
VTNAFVAEQLPCFDNNLRAEEFNATGCTQK